MTYSLIIGGEREFPFATLSGWKLLKDVIETQDSEIYPELYHLMEHSFSQHIPELIKEFQELSMTGLDSNLETIVDRTIVELSKVEGSAESVFISNGLTSKKIVESWES